MKNNTKPNYNAMFDDEKLSVSDQKITINDNKENQFKGVKNPEKITTVPESSPNESGNFLSKVKTLFKFGKSNSNVSNSTQESVKTEEQLQSSCKDKLMKKLQDNIEIEKSYKTFFILLTMGLGLLCLSLIFLPFIILSPHKFILCFSFGSLIILISFIFIYGTKKYFEILFSANRFLFTILFLASILLGIFLSLAGYFFFSVLCAISQLITLIVFTLSFIPGGSGGISFIGRMLSSPFSNFFMRIRGQSYLPS
jgi:hypothetical protein